MMKSATIVLVLACCALAGCGLPDRDTIVLDPDRLPYRFAETEYHANRNSYTHFVDLDGDGLEARITITYGEGSQNSSVVSARYNGTTISSITLPPAHVISCEFAQDINNDGYKEIFLLSHEGNTMVLSIVNVYATGDTGPIYRRFPLSCSADTLTEFSSNESLRLHGLMQGDNRRTPILIASFSSQRPSRPSSILGIDALTGALVWTFAMGPRPALPSTALPGLPTQSAIFLGTTSTGTAANAGGMNDAHTYMLGLRQDGRLLWTPRVLGGAFATSRLFLSDIDSHGEEELVCFFSSSNRQLERSYLKIFNPRNGAQVGATKEFPQRIIVPDELPVVTQNQRRLFVVCTFSGTISLLDENFKTVLERQFPAEVVGLQIKNILGDDEKEVIVSLRTDKSVILNLRLEPLALLNWSADVSLSRCNAKGEQTLVLKTGRNVLVGSLLPNSGLAREVILWASLGLGALIIGYISYRSFLYIRVFTTSVRNSRDIAIVLLSGRGKILMANPAFCANHAVPRELAVGRRWDHCLDKEHHKPTREFLSRIVTAREPLVDQIELYSPAFSGTLLMRVYPVLVGRFRLGTFITMHDITRVLRGDRMVNWAKVAHNMAHEMKTPLSTIWFTLARIRQEVAAGAGAKVEAHLESIEEEVRRVDNYLRGFMKLADINPPIALPVDLNATVTEILRAYAAKLPDATKVELDLAPGLPLVNIDVNLFTVALKNLSDNAVTAMKGRGILRVSTYLVQNLNDATVYLTLSDTGNGIAEEDIPRVFQPYFTRAERGTGLGLVITKKIVEDHEGSISFSTRPGLGTEFVIQLPVSDRPAGGSHAS